ncbi:SrfA family protein [Serratia ureilytica]|uniref:SrfA family protein n=1 Tax=Serratia ureilytica TaxID=300181 RepID=UPI0030C70C71
MLPPEAVKAGSTRFLNGKWRATVALKDPITGKRPSLQYRLNAGKGSAVIAYGDGVTCRVAVEAGLMQSGNLVINSRTKARCSDGSRYQIPEIVCRQGETGTAECTGRYDADTTYPMTFKRESK